MLKVTRQIAGRYYLFLLLAVIAQAFFIVLAGNQKIEKNQQLTSLEKQKTRLEKEVRDLENDLALNQSMLRHKTDEQLMSEFTEIKNREVVHNNMPVASAENTQQLALAYE